MPYSSITELPDAVRSRYSERCQEVFRTTFNNAMSSSTGGGSASEQSAFKIAHTAAGNCKASGKSERSPLVDMTVKFAEGSDTIIEGYGVPFGLDLDGQQFTAKSDLCLDWFPNGGRPILYHHGFDDKVKFAAIGHEIESELTEDGLWVRAQLDKASKYYSRVKQLVEKGAVGWSSGAPDHKVKIAKDGTIERWPAVEFSLTPTPAKPNTVAYAMKSTDLDAIKDEMPDVPSLIEQAHGDDSEPEPLADHSQRVLAEVKAWVGRMEERSDFRAKSGRELSKANVETLREAHRILGALLERADKPREDEAEASKSEAEFLRLEAELLGAAPG